MAGLVFGGECFRRAARLLRRRSGFGGGTGGAPGLSLTPTECDKFKPPGILKTNGPRHDAKFVLQPRQPRRSALREKAETKATTSQPSWSPTLPNCGVGWGALFRGGLYGKLGRASRPVGRGYDWFSRKACSESMGTTSSRNPFECCIGTILLVTRSERTSAGCWTATWRSWEAFL